ncbi:uncharacterized protein LOC111253167 [Varroa destructor]|uniref:Uncharacterized protein n=1 Tax=Varroa destructor TaxID=109461 RepID=A0A7M7KZG0_VARDE|nr:uncharacterized protein LOC111253167 [Varroa destructor]
MTSAVRNGSYSPSKEHQTPGKEATLICSKMTEVELREFIERQKKILKNTLVLSKLSDKGEQVRRKLEAAETELRSRDKIQGLETTIEMISNFTLKDERDKENFDGLRANNESLPKYADKLAEKIEQRQKQSKKKFQPNRSLKYEAEIKPEHAVKWETFPDLKAADTKPPCVLSIKESIRIARENAAREKLEILALAGVKLSAREMAKIDDHRIDYMRASFRALRNGCKATDTDGFDSDDDDYPALRSSFSSDDDDDDDISIKHNTRRQLEELD